jgi:hypothetical protein
MLPYIAAPWILWGTKNKQPGHWISCELFEGYDFAAAAEFAVAVLSLTLTSMDLTKGNWGYLTVQKGTSYGDNAQ